MYIIDFMKKDIKLLCKICIKIIKKVNPYTSTGTYISKYIVRYQIVTQDFWIRQYPYKSHIFRVIDILAHNFL